MPIGGGGRTPDSFPGERVDESLLLLSGSVYPIDVGEVTYVSGAGFAFMQDDGIAFIRSGNISSTDHEILRQLIHLDDEDGPRGIQWPSGLIKDTDSSSPFPSGSVWWSDSTRTKKIVDQIIVRNSHKLPVSVSWRVYGSDGTTIVESYTDVITFNGIFEQSRKRIQGVGTGATSATATSTSTNSGIGSGSVVYQTVPFAFTLQTKTAYSIELRSTVAGNAGNFQTYTQTVNVSTDANGSASINGRNAGQQFGTPGGTSWTFSIGTSGSNFTFNVTGTGTETIAATTKLTYESVTVPT